MKITLYKTIKNAKGLPRVVKQKNFEYRDLKFDCAENISQMMHDVFMLHKQTEEYLYQLCMDSIGNLLGIFEISHGTVDCTCVSSREIFQKAMLVGATGFVLVHNHPSGNLKPSKDDILVMDSIKEASKLMNIKLLDTIVIGDGYYSFHQQLNTL